MRFVIIQTAFLGDVILTSPILEVLWKSFPGCSIDYVARPDVVNILQCNPYIRTIIPFDKKGKDRGFKGISQMIQVLKSRSYDAAVVPHRSFRSAWLVFRAKIPLRIGYKKSAAPFLFTHRVAYDHTKHEMHRLYDLLQPLSISLPLPPLCIYTSTVDREMADQLWKKEQLESSSAFIGMAPGSIWATKRWPPERYGSLARKLGEAKGVRTVIFGGNEDREVCDIVVRNSGGWCVNTAGIFSMRESASAMKRTKVLITNDSGAMHLAVGMQVPVIAIFGPTDTRFGFAPLGDNNTIIEKSLDCRPCGSHGSKRCPEKHFRCMMDISVEEVYSAVLKYIEKP